HGVKFNGTRALIADNYFENINGNAILPGYTSEVSGHGARDVVVSSNTILRCGWTPIEVRSTSGLGGNLIIRGNRISEIRDAAIDVRGCTGVTISGNEFSSFSAPAKGAWVIGTDAADIRCEANRYPAETPEFKMNKKAK
ncbi:MAG: right-handed parallel beta-helix repeat-containing protein, partial [Kiritimatiellaeota bacterium]|nr:right-handed parallel beta-helix repeat-containing protein [Kiritimatiellota bacterium]